MYCEVYAVKPADAARLGDPASAAKVLTDAPSVSLEKAWHGLHYLMTGSAWEGDGPLSFLLQGGEALADEDEEDGPPRLLSPAEVQELDAALTPLTEDALWSRFDPEAMEADDIYPNIWDEAEEDLKEEYLHYFRELKTLVRRAKDDGKGLVVSIG
jgi:hypothetical protein